MLDNHNEKETHTNNLVLQELYSNYTKKLWNLFDIIN